MGEKIVYTGKTKKGNDLVIRYPIIEDVGAMHEYINALSKEQTFIRFQGEEISLEEEQKYVEEMLKLIREHKAIKLVAICNGEFAGMGDVTQQDKVHSHVAGVGLSVKKEYRGEGIGKMLFVKLLEEAEKNMPEVKILKLGVFSNNDLAISMYKNSGFKEYGRLPKGVKHKGDFVDHIEMYKTV